MRLLAIILVAAALGWGGPARADDASAADHRAIERVITAQIEAFRHDEGPAAFGFASPNIQSMFGDPEHFMAMVRQGYPPVYRPRSFRFEALETVDGRLVQHVAIIGPDGGPATALYTMERQPDGSWRIDGCVLTEPRRITA